MNIPRQTEMPHKLALYSLLQKLLSDPFIANNIYFKGGTCAAMLNYLDRFSIDLDFDLLDKSKKIQLRQSIHQVIKNLGYSIKDESRQHLQFFLKYRDLKNERNTLKLEISDLVSKANQYQKTYLIEIDKYCQAQTVQTMFANKMVALKARWEEGKGVAGRDMYDLHHFFKQGYAINQAVIVDLRKIPYLDYLSELIIFIKKNVSEQILYEDLNPLISKNKLSLVVPLIKSEVLIALNTLIKAKN